MKNEPKSSGALFLNKLIKMKTLKYILISFAMLIGFSVSSFAQQQPKDPPPKKDPPVVVVKDKDKDKEKPKDNDQNKDNKPKKPEEFLGIELFLNKD